MTPTNVQANRGVWDNYASVWSPDTPFVRQMASDVNKTHVGILGEEWSDSQSFNQVMQEMILPYCQGTTVLEIGVGGG